MANCIVLKVAKVDFVIAIHCIGDAYASQRSNDWALSCFVFGLSLRSETHTAKFKSAVILALVCFYGNGAIHSHARARGLSMI